MKANYPVADGKGGISQQRLELLSHVQREGVKRLLRAAGIQPEGLRTIVDLGCRNGDTTLGLAQIASDGTTVIGVEEVSEALAVARYKFLIGAPYDIKRMNPGMLDILLILPELCGRLLDYFRTTALALPKGSVHFIYSPIEQLPQVLNPDKADLIVGFQLLHWLNADETGMPTLEVMHAICESLAPGGIFISGTSTAFVAIKPEDCVEGKTRAEYSVDEHPFFRIVYDFLARLVLMATNQLPVPVSAAPLLDMAALAALFESVGFTGVRTGAFLSTFGRELAVTEQIKLRPVHQGRLNGVNDGMRTALLEAAIMMANSHCERMVALGQGDPRMDGRHIYDAVPFVVARKA